jgi:hypothetical protein
MIKLSELCSSKVELASGQDLLIRFESLEFTRVYFRSHSVVS